MIPAFVIHHKACQERHEIVEKLCQQTGATIFPAILLSDGVEGCRLSHIEVARLAKQKYPDQHYLVFEDDCVLAPHWGEMIDTFKDLVYLGYNDKCDKATFGTHALLISPLMRDIIINVANQDYVVLKFQGKFDWILSYLAKAFEVKIKLPQYDDRNKYCWQKKGLRSLITYAIRE